MISYSDPDIWYTSSVPHDMLITDGTVTVSGDTYSVSGATVTIRNDILNLEEFELNQTLCSESQLTFGCCESGYVEFTINEVMASSKGKTLKVYVIPGHKASKMLQLGVFKVVEDELTANNTQRKIKAYDAMYDILNADVSSWYNTELPDTTTTKTLAQFRADFLSHFNITTESTTLINDSITIKRTIDADKLSGADVIKAICEINGVFGTITNEGKFRYVELPSDLNSGLFPSETLYLSTTLYPQDVNSNILGFDDSQYISIDFQDYMAESITGLIIRTNNDDAGVTVGTNTNVYTVTGNFLVYGYDNTSLTSVATNLLTKMTVRYYRPCTIEAIGNPLVEVGDGVLMSTKYRGVATYILKRSLKGIHAFKDTYSSTGEQYYMVELNSINSQFKQMSGKISSLVVETDHISSTVTDLDTREASHYTQTTGQIDLKVTKGTVSSEISIESGQVTFNSNRLVVTSTNFELTASGDATFKGNVTGATISGGTISGTSISGGTISGATITSTGTESGETRTTTIENGSISTNFINLNDGKIRNLSEIRFGTSSWRMYDSTQDFYYAGTSPAFYHPVHIQGGTSPYFSVTSRANNVESSSLISPSGLSVYNSSVASISLQTTGGGLVQINADPTYPQILIQDSSSNITQITTSGMTIAGNSVLTSASNLTASKLLGLMSSNVVYPDTIYVDFNGVQTTLSLIQLPYAGNSYLMYAKQM